MLELDLTKQNPLQKKQIECYHSVTSVSWSPDGTKIVSASTDRTIRVWSIDTGECLQTLKGHIGGVLAVSWSPDGKKIASASYDFTIRVWSANTGQCLKTLEGHTYWNGSVAWSPDSKKIVSGSYDATIKIWSANTGECLQTLKGHTKDVSSVSWSPDGTTIASGSGDTTVRVWSTETGVCLSSMWVSGPRGPVTSVGFNHDGSKIVSASDGDTTVRVWSTNTGVCERTLKGHEGYVESVSWSPDGTTIASGSVDKTIRVWSANTGECLQTLKGHTNNVNSVSWSPDGTTIASGSSSVGMRDKTIRVWSLNYPYILPILDDIEKLKTMYPDGDPHTTVGPNGQYKTYQPYKISFGRIRIYHNTFDIDFHAKVYYNDKLCGNMPLHLTATPDEKGKMLFLLQICPRNDAREEDDECEPAYIQIRTTFNHLFFKLIHESIRFVDQPVNPNSYTFRKKRVSRLTVNRKKRKQPYRRLKNNIKLRF